MAEKFAKLIIEGRASRRIGVYGTEALLTCRFLAARQGHNLAVVTLRRLGQIALSKGIEGWLFAARTTSEHTAKLKKDQDRGHQEEQCNEIARSHEYRQA